MFSFLREVDIFDKLYDDEMKKEENPFGVLLSVILATFGLTLFFSDFIYYISPDFSRELDTQYSMAHDISKINLSLTIGINTPCNLLHLDVIDPFSLDNMVNNSITFRRFSSNGTLLSREASANESKCMECYGLKPAGSCCNDCQELLLLNLYKGNPVNESDIVQCKGYNDVPPSIDEKCLIKGKLTINRISGSFHIAPGRNTNSSIHIHEIAKWSNLSHSIERLRFGPKLPTATMPLEGLQQVTTRKTNVAYIYNLLVTRVMLTIDGDLVENGNEYIIVSTTLSSDYQPGIYFSYDFTPYSIVVRFNTKSALEYMVSTSAMMTGIYLILAIVDKLFADKIDQKEVAPTETNVE